MNRSAGSGLMATTLCLALSIQAFPGQSGQGFLGIPWGTGRAAVETRFDLRLTSARGAYERYRASLESLGQAALEDCQFEFVDGGFFGVAIQTRGASNTDALRNYLTETLGTGRNADDGSVQWIVNGAHIVLDEDSAGDGYLYWYHGPVAPTQR